MAREGGKLQELPASKGGFHSDICDAVLYGWRACYGWAERAPSPPPTEIQVVDEWWKKEERAIEQRNSSEWWEEGG
jgi:hypothetical protein